MTTSEINTAITFELVMQELLEIAESKKISYEDFKKWIQTPEGVKIFSDRMKEIQ